MDELVYGHSGRPASDILNQLALGTPEGIAKKLLPRELLEKSSELKDEIKAAEEAKNVSLVKQKKAELKRIETILGDQSLLAKEIDSYVIKNKRKLEVYARLAGGNTKALLSDVEPVCEPVAFVLNDALAQKDPKTLNADLTELAAFYPHGEIEPGWADLIRTRRFIVYTDGGSYCRLFLPGSNAEQAWKSAFPVVRHVLLSLLKQDALGETLAVDAYAYENDIAKTTFTLSLTKHSLKVTAHDLGTPVGLKSLDFTALAHFFADGQTLEGCGVDATGQLVLIGSKGKKPTLEGQPIELSDLAVAYRASAYAGHGESYMSLDKAEDDDFVNVNFGGRLHDTRMGWVAYRCDLRFKTLGDDFDAVTFEPLRNKILAKLPNYNSQQQRRFSDAAFRDISEEGTRFWFYPDDFKVVTAVDGKSCLVTRPRFTAAAERQESYDKDGKKMDSTTPLWTSLTLDHFNKNYDNFAELFNEVAELDHAARLLGVAEWLYQAAQKGVLALDLDQLLSLSLPVNPTPRMREQIQINYAVKKTGIPAEFKAYCVSTPRGKAAFERELKEYKKPTSEFTLLSVIGGGLDFSARKAVKQSANASESQQSVLRKSMTSKDAFKAPDGRDLKTSAAFGGNGPPMKPPSKGFVTASAPEPGPKGIGFDGAKRRFRNTKGNELDGFVVQESGMKRLQKSDAEMFYKDGPLHSVWVGEHGAPDRFAMSTTKGVITYRLPEQNGILTAKLISGRRVPTEGELDFLAAALAEKNGSLPQVWNMAPVDAEIRAIDMTPGKEALVYYRDKGGDVLRIYKGEAKPTVVKGPDALARLHDASREKVRTFSLPGKVELLHIATDGDNVVLQIGKREPIRIKKAEWGNWLSAEGESAPPEALAAVYSDLIKSDAELVVMRDALQSRPRRLGGKDFSLEDLFGVVAIDKKSREIALLKLTTDELQAQIDGVANAITREPGLKAKLEVALSEIKKTQAIPATEKAELLAAREKELKNELAKLAAHQIEGDAVSLAGVLKTKLHKVGSTNYLGGRVWLHCQPLRMNLVWWSERSRCLMCS